MTTSTAGPGCQGLDDSGYLACGARSLAQDGFVHLTALWPTWARAKRDAIRIIEAVHAGDPIGRGLPGLSVVGEFIAPPSGAVRRDYQVLHVDFGWPIAPEVPVDITRFTALHIDVQQPGSDAVTRIVQLRPLLKQRAWPEPDELAERLLCDGGPDRPVEGILGRLIEAIDGGGSLPPPATPGFLCGMEFATADEESGFFRSHGLNLAEVEQHVVLQPGEVLVIDNLRSAHGRIGRRYEDEIHQLFVGYPLLAHDSQRVLLDRILLAFR
jgi:hypothetical protein